MLDENAIKTALVKRLHQKGFFDEQAIFVDELAVGCERRADLVVANGKLSAFEIKSDLDRLDRLVGQLTTYEKFFDKVYLVCTEKHVDQALDLASPRVEVWQVKARKDGSVNWKICKRGQSALITDHSALLGFATRKDIVRFIRENRLSFSPKASRFELLEYAQRIPVEKTRGFALSLIKSKYAEYHASLIGKLESGSDFSLAASAARIARPGAELPQKREPRPRAGFKSPPRRVLDVSKGWLGRTTSGPIYVIPKGG